MSTTAVARDTHNAAIAFDRFVRAVRKDVWNSYDLRAGDPHTIVIRHAHQHTVSWRYDPHTRAARRIESTPRQPDRISRYPNLPTGVRFSVDRADLLIALAPGRTRSAESIRLVSQLRILKGRAQ